MKTYFYFLVFILIASSCKITENATAQSNIVAQLEYKKNINFQFTEEWQYLSTDVYVFNGSKFQEVLNKVKKKRGEEMESIFLSLKLKDVKLFDKENVIYPLFNFKVESERKGYTTHVGDNIEVVRVLDKYPISMKDNTLDAEINIKAVTNNKTNEMMQMIANQLLNVSKIMNPTAAVMSLVGEYGNLIQSTSNKTEYRFSSTIRLYEEQNFDMKLHSVRIYMLIPSDSYYPKPDLIPLTKYLDATANPQIDFQTLKKIIAYTQYPFLVVANYKSLYKMEGVTGDEITKDNIEKRRQRVEKDHNIGLIKDEPYQQEKQFINFLENFNSLKNNINLYNLNYEIRNTEAIAKNLFSIIQSFNTLKTTYLSRQQEYRGNPIYTKIFKPEYESIFANSELYLEKDPNLRSVKELVNTLYSLNRLSTNQISTEETENYLRKLHQIDLPDANFMSSSAEGQSILKNIKELEANQFSNVFADQISRLASTSAIPQNLDVRNVLLGKAKTTNCKMCRDKAIESISEFNARLDKYKVKQTLSRKDSIINIANNRLLDFFPKKDCITKNLAKPEISSKLGSSKDFINQRFTAVTEKMDKLQKKIVEKIEFNKVEEIDAFVLSIEQLIDEIDNDFKTICKVKELCDCTTTDPVKKEEPKK